MYELGLFILRLIVGMAIGLAGLTLMFLWWFL